MFHQASFGIYMCLLWKINEIYKFTMGIGLDSLLSDFDGNSEGVWELLLSRVARVTAWFSAGPFEFRCASEPQIEAS
jgi:hypothetical protein